MIIELLYDDTANFQDSVRGASIKLKCSACMSIIIQLVIQTKATSIKVGVLCMHEYYDTASYPDSLNAASITVKFCACTSMIILLNIQTLLELPASR